MTGDNPLVTGGRSFHQGQDGFSAEPLERHLYAMKSKGSVAEEASVALLPSVTLTFQKPACQGFACLPAGREIASPGPGHACPTQYHL